MDIKIRCWDCKTIITVVGNEPIEGKSRVVKCVCGSEYWVKVSVEAQRVVKTTEPVPVVVKES